MKPFCRSEKRRYGETKETTNGTKEHKRRSVLLQAQSKAGLPFERTKTPVKQSLQEILLGLGAVMIRRRTENLAHSDEVISV